MSAAAAAAAKPPNELDSSSRQQARVAGQSSSIAASECASKGAVTLSVAHDESDVADISECEHHRSASEVMFITNINRAAPDAAKLNDLRAKLCESYSAKHVEEAGDVTTKRLTLEATYCNLRVRLNANGNQTEMPAQKQLQEQSGEV